MAIMIPHKPFDTNSEGEAAIFHALESGLDNSYIVFHSVRWVKSSKKSQGEADFLVLHKRLGILVFEVKSGFIKCEGRTWYQTNRKTLEEKPIQDPLSQADGSKFKFIELLNDYQTPIRNCLVCHAVWFPSFNWTYPYPTNYSSEIVLDKTNLINPQVAIEGVFDYWSKLIRPSNYDNTIFNQLKFLIAPEFTSVPSIRANFENREQLFISLTKEQARIMDFLEEQSTAVISGSAGTGKTMLALEKANRLGVRNEETLFLCFNEALKVYLEENNPIKFVHFKTIHELALEFIAHESSSELNEVTFELADFLLSNESQWHYQNVIIDEAQDFNSFFIEILQKITKGCFYAFYDKNQNIYQKEELTWAINAVCKLTLHVNCRNTKEIARTSARNIGLDSKSFNESPIKGEQSHIKQYILKEDGINLIENIVGHLLNDKNANPEDIVILTMKTNGESILNKVNTIQNTPLSKHLKKGFICFNSVDEFKGLEAGYLILIEVTVANYSIQRYRNRLYIGCSRAKQGLYILLENPKEEDFVEAMNAIETKKKIKRNRVNFFYKLAVTELEL